MPTPATYSLYAIQSFTPVLGWQAVYLMETEHEASPIHALAHVQEHRYVLHTRDRLPDVTPDGEDWDISAVAYNSIDGWTLCIEDSNFCGLLPPGDTLEAFLADHTCRAKR